MMEIESTEQEISTITTKKVRIQPWVEKYRPDKMEDVSHQDEVIQTLKKSVDSGNLMHLLFHGPPGTGKTTTILALARALYGPELYRSRILELNASDERGIKIIRDKVKTFAQGSVGGQKTPGYPCPRFKLVILDEADTMTPDSQSALRRIIENYSKVTRFCLICNYVTRVIEPLASRCAKFRFKPLPVESMKNRIADIAARENVTVDDATVDVILSASGGDMRKAVTYLQSAHQLSATSDNNNITADLVVEISGLIPKKVIEVLWQTMSGHSFDKMKIAVSDVVYSGYSMSAVISQLHDDVVSHATLSDIDKALISEKLAQSEQCLLDGCCEFSQLLDVSAFIMRRITKTDALVDSLTNKH